MLIKVKVFSSSKKQGISKTKKDSFEVNVKEKPIQGQANQAVVNILAEYFKVSQKKIKLIKGFRQRNKVFKIWI